MDDDLDQYPRNGLGVNPQARLEPLPTLEMAPTTTTPRGVLGSAMSWMFGPQRSTSSPPLISATSTPSITPTNAPTLLPAPSPTFALGTTRGRLPPRPTSTTSTSDAASITVIPDESDDNSMTVIIPRVSSFPTSRTSRPSTLQTITSDSSLLYTDSQTDDLPLMTIQPLQPSKSSRTSTIKSLSRTSSSATSVIPPAGFTGTASSSQNLDGSQASNNKSSGALIGGIAGGISGVILIALSIFLCWKLRRRREREFDKRSSFDPYANGIDASRGGLLVSSVPYKPADQLSEKETLYSDDHSPTRYQQSEAKTSEEIPAPVSMESTPRTYTESPTPTLPPAPLVPAPVRRPLPHDQFREPFPPYQPEPPMHNSLVPAPLRPHHSRPYPQLYDRRRPPVPPSMRRARSPMHRMYGSYPPRPNPVFNDLVPGGYAMDTGGLSFAGPYPQSSNPLRSNSMQGHHQSRSVELARLERNRQIHRSASVGSMNQRPYGPQHPPRSMPDGPYQGVPRPSARYQRPLHPTAPPNHAMHPHSSNSYGFYDDANFNAPRRGLTVRNPTPVFSGAEARVAAKPSLDLVQRATNNNNNVDESMQGPEHAARNF